MNASQPIHIPAYMVDLIGKWRHASARLEETLGRLPNNSEMCEALGLPLDASEQGVACRHLEHPLAPSAQHSHPSRAVGVAARRATLERRAARRDRGLQRGRVPLRLFCRFANGLELGAFLLSRSRCKLWDQSAGQTWTWRASSA